MGGMRWTKEWLGLSGRGQLRWGELPWWGVNPWEDATTGVGLLAMRCPRRKALPRGSHGIPGPTWEECSREDVTIQGTDVELGLWPWGPVPAWPPPACGPSLMTASGHVPSHDPGPDAGPALSHISRGQRSITVTVCLKAVARARPTPCFEGAFSSCGVDSHCPSER